VTASSDDLHPTSGARFVLTRAGEAYDVLVCLPEGHQLRSKLAWDERGHATLDPPLPHQAAHDETLKLARVLKRTPKERLSRWRPV
jgi:hypothetical protein